MILGIKSKKFKIKSQYSKKGEVTIFVVVSANTYPAQTVLTVKANVKESK